MTGAHSDATADLMRAGLCRHCATEVVSALEMAVAKLLPELPGGLCSECDKAIGNWIVEEAHHG
jgi:hypothetical protein